jgi:hypothetical protein
VVFESLLIITTRAGNVTIPTSTSGVASMLNPPSWCAVASSVSRPADAALSVTLTVLHRSFYISSIYHPIEPCPNPTA